MEHKQNPLICQITFEVGSSLAPKHRSGNLQVGGQQLEAQMKMEFLREG